MSHPRRRLNSLLGSVLSIVAVLAICGSGVSMASTTSSHHRRHHSKPKPHRKVVGNSLPGTWSGQYSGAFSGTFTIHWTQSGSNLNGSIMLSNPSGTYSINGSVHGSALTFGAVGAGATYTGSVSGTSMSGTYNSPKGGGAWSAHKTG
jgi:hypothetical protein